MIKKSQSSRTYFDAKNFIAFMRRPDSVTRILYEHAQMTQDSQANQDFKTMRTNKNASALIRPPRKVLHCLTKSITHEMINATNRPSSYDVSKFICTKHPTKDSLREFWTMILDQNASVIVDFSSANDKITHKYWNSKEDSKFSCNEFKIKTTRVRTMDCYTMTLLQLKQKGKVIREISHFCYTGWPSDNLSHSPMQFASFISIVSDVSTWTQPNQDVLIPGPIVVHCNDGIDVKCVLSLKHVYYGI